MWVDWLMWVDWFCIQQIIRRIMTWKASSYHLWLPLELNMCLRCIDFYSNSRWKILFSCKQVTSNMNFCDRCMRSPIFVSLFKVRTLHVQNLNIFLDFWRFGFALVVGFLVSTLCLIFDHTPWSPGRWAMRFVDTFFCSVILAFLWLDEMRGRQFS